MNRRQFIAKLPALFAAMVAVPAAMAGIRGKCVGVRESSIGFGVCHSDQPNLFATTTEFGGRPWGKPVVAVHPDLLKRKTVRVSKEFMDDAMNVDYHDSIRRFMQASSQQVD